MDRVPRPAPHPLHKCRGSNGSGFEDKCGVLRLTIVSKILAKHCAVSLVTSAVGGGPQGIAFDGANMWVSNYNSNNVAKLRATDGATIATVPVGKNPHGVAFDGANIWIANSSSNTVSKL